VIRLLIAFTALAFAQAQTQARLELTAGKSRVIEVAGGVERVAVGSGDVLEALAVSPTEVLVHAKAAGNTTLLVWPKSAARQEYDVRVVPSPERFDSIRSELQRELGNTVSLDVQDNLVFLRGTVADVSQAERASAIAGNLGKIVNLLRVAVGPAPSQVLLKVRFADVDRVASTELGANFFSTGAGNTPGSVTTGQFSPPTPQNVNGRQAGFTISDALNVFLFRPDLNLGATIKALQSRNLLQILAEPNLLAFDGKEASFLAGGEFPYPVVQGSTGYTTVTIQFRQFGIKINFIPTITPRGAIHLQVSPEVSSLDYANGLTYQGFTVPSLSVRKIQTEIELENNQSFAIAGLLDNRVTDGLSKIPGLGNIPFFGRLFQSRAVSRSKGELLVVVTPELVQPIPAGTAAPSITMPGTFLKGGDPAIPSNPPATAAVRTRESIPLEELLAPPAAPAPAPGGRK